MSGVLAVIPARLGSTRFPGKALYPYHGIPLLQYVWQEVQSASEIDQTIIATDNVQISNAARAFGAEVFRTSSRHKTGSDRVAEVASKRGASIILNVQADNLGIQKSDLNRLVRFMKSHKTASCGTIVHKISSRDDLSDTNKVKVARSRDGRALWFSRLPVPFDQTRSTFAGNYWGHIGVYAFRRDAMKSFAAAPQSEAEKRESLEQLRLFELGIVVHTVVSKSEGISVDSPGDLKKLDRIFGTLDRKSTHGTR